MARKRRFKNAFTLVEVMVAVMIISVVIVALLQMFANNTHIFLSLKQQTKINQYASFLIANDTYGWERDKISVYRLIEDFDVQTDLRRELKDTKVELLYKELQIIDLSEEDLDEEGSSLIFEIGRSLMKSKDSSTAMLRFKVQE